jgi:hypothetical protein
VLLIEVSSVFLHENSGTAHLSDVTTSVGTGTGNFWIGGLSDDGPVEEVSEGNSHFGLLVIGNRDLNLLADLDCVFVSIYTLLEFDTHFLGLIILSVHGFILELVCLLIKHILGILIEIFTVKIFVEVGSRFIIESGIFEISGGCSEIGRSGILIELSRTCGGR